MSELQTPKNIKKKQYAILIGVGSLLVVALILFLNVVTGSSEPKAQQKMKESKIADPNAHRDPREIWAQKMETENKELKEKLVV